MDLADHSGNVLEDRLMYGDWLRTHPNAHQSKYVNGSLSRNYGRPPRPIFSNSGNSSVGSGSRRENLEKEGTDLQDVGKDKAETEVATGFKNPEIRL